MAAVIKIIFQRNKSTAYFRLGQVSQHGRAHFSAPYWSGVALATRIKQISR
jgi:hypothetical protein